MIWNSFRQLIADGADVNFPSNDEGATPFHVACACHNMEIIEECLRQKNLDLFYIDKRGRVAFDLLTKHELYWGTAIKWMRKYQPKHYAYYLKFTGMQDSWSSEYDGPLRAFYYKHIASRIL